ncbi:hypothetical protein Tsubulata_035582, partial [Turnera subulata]
AQKLVHAWRENQTTTNDKSAAKGLVALPAATHRCFADKSLVCEQADGAVVGGKSSSGFSVARPDWKSWVRFLNFWKDPVEKSRRQRRKKAREEKKQMKHQSWQQRHELQKRKRDELSSHTNPKPKRTKKSKNLGREILEEKEGGEEDVVAGMHLGSEELDLNVESPGLNVSHGEKMKKGKSNLRRKSRTKFQEYLQREMKDNGFEEDLKLEKRLAKKLKVKDGKLKAAADDLDMLLEGIPSALGHFDEGVDPTDAEEFPSERIGNDASKKELTNLESWGDFSEDQSDVELKGVSEEEKLSDGDVGLEENVANTSSTKKRKRKNKSKRKQKMEGDTVDVVFEPSEPRDTEEVAPERNPTEAPIEASRVKYVAPHMRSSAGNESEEHIQIRRRVRGLLNRLSESNVESVTGEVATIFRSVTRNVGTKIIGDEVVAACSSGPRGNEQYAAVFAAFVAGMACSVGMDFSAKLLASLAKSFEDEYLKKDDLSLRNLTLLLSYLYIFGVFSSDMVYDFLIMLSKRLTEIDVATILTVLQCCGMKVRGDDPISMKNFIQSVQDRVNELKTSSQQGHTHISSKRMEFMLETICDIKNNKKRPKEETATHTRIKKWLQKLRVEDILIRGLKWSKLIDPDKKGQWWLSGDMAAATDNVEEVANTIDKEVLEAQKMLQLAASQRMNTDARKAIFCVIMSGDDYIDAFEKLLRLDLPGKQDREIMRVLVDCCLQEKVFNKYYTVLASKLCEYDKNHKFTLQFCLWDQFKELESMQLLRSMHLAKFVAEMVASFTLSLAVLKSVDFTDATELTPRRIMHFRMLFEALFEYPDNVIWNIFTRIAVTPELENLRDGLTFFIREYVLKTNSGIASKFKVAKKALNNAEGVLM